MAEINLLVNWRSVPLNEVFYLFLTILFKDPLQSLWCKLLLTIYLHLKFPLFPISYQLFYYFRISCCSPINKCCATQAGECVIVRSCLMMGWRSRWHRRTLVGFRSWGCSSVSRPPSIFSRVLFVNPRGYSVGSSVGWPLNKLKPSNRRSLTVSQQSYFSGIKHILVIFGRWTKSHRNTRTKWTDVKVQNN